MGLDFPGGLIGFHEFLIRSCRIYFFFCMIGRFIDSILLKKWFLLCKLGSYHTTKS